MDIREITTTWRTDAGSNFKTVMFCDAAGVVANQRTAIGALWTGVDLCCASTTTWTVDTSGREMDDATGTLTGSWFESTAHTDNGDGAGDQSGDALQALIRWGTAAIRNGRFVQGRSFVPGISATGIVDGNLSAANITAVNAAALTFIGSAALFGIWHRPQGSLPGEWLTATSGVAWSELAVQRNRRG